MTKQTITAVFDTRAHADSAALSLRQIGIPATNVTLSPEDARNELSTRYEAGMQPKTGFMASLERLFGGYDDQDTYAEGVRRGCTLLTAHVDDRHVDQCVSLLEQDGAIDLEEREETWRNEGWTGGQIAGGMAATGAVGAGATGLAMTGTAPAATVAEVDAPSMMPAARTAAPARTETVARTEATATTPLPRAAAPTRAAPATGEEALQIVEERLNVGKRAVSRGRVRLHSYLVETQVSEDVTLRDETVTVDRRTVDRPVAALGADAFQERTVEMEEVNEEAVVSKTARVVGEVGLRKEAVDRVETVRDTVRSTKVDVEDGRTAGTAVAGVGAGFASRLVKDLEVVGSDGAHVGVIDRLDGAMIKLKSMDPTSIGQHHLLPVDLVQSIDGKAVLSVAAAEAMRRWTAA